jgi:lipid-binding SYLF domain-containing protein
MSVNWSRTLSLFLFLFCVLTVADAQQVNSDKLNTAKRRSTKSAKALSEILALTNDKSITRELLNKAKAIAVFPETTQLTFFTQKGMKAYGLISRREGNEWTVPAFYRFSLIRYGLTLFKVESQSVIILFMSDENIKFLKKDRMKPAAQAGPIGEYRPETDRTRDAILIYGLDDKGLRSMAVEKDLTLGIEIDSDNNINKVVYGLKARDVIWKTKPLPPSIPDEVVSFQRTLNEAIKSTPW